MTSTEGPSSRGPEGETISSPLVTFDEDIALRQVADGAYAGHLADGWDTPRGPLGGYVMALLLEGLDATVADPTRRPRSITVHFLRPPHAGPVEVTATVERRGRAMTTVSGRLEQDGKPIALGLAAFSTPWEGPLLADAPMPDVAPPDLSRPSAASPDPAREPPSFLTQMTMQHRFGDAPFTRSARGEVGGWLGLREDRPVDAAALVVLADAWFPAAWPRLKQFAPAPTIDLTVHFRAPLPVPDTLLLGRFTSTLVRDGFFEEDGQLWTADGTLVAQSRQLGLLIAAEA